MRREHFEFFILFFIKFKEYLFLLTIWFFFLILNILPIWDNLFTLPSHKAEWIDFFRGTVLNFLFSFHNGVYILKIFPVFDMPLLFCTSLHKKSCFFIFFVSLISDAVLGYNFGFTGIRWFVLVFFIRNQNTFDRNSSRKELFFLYFIFCIADCFLRFFSLNILFHESISSHIIPLLLGESLTFTYLAKFLNKSHIPLREAS
jgi:hypothetical protein